MRGTLHFPIIYPQMTGQCKLVGPWHYSKVTPEGSYPVSVSRIRHSAQTSERHLWKAALPGTPLAVPCLSSGPLNLLWSLGLVWYVPTCSTGTGTEGKADPTTGWPDPWHPAARPGPPPGEGSQEIAPIPHPHSECLSCSASSIWTTSYVQPSPAAHLTSHLGPLTAGGRCSQWFQSA